MRLYKIWNNCRMKVYFLSRVTQKCKLIPFFTWLNNVYVPSSPQLSLGICVACFAILPQTFDPDLGESLWCIGTSIQHVPQLFEIVVTRAHRRPFYYSSLFSRRNSIVMLAVWRRALSFIKTKFNVIDKERYIIPKNCVYIDCSI